MAHNMKFYDTIARFYDAENAEMTDDLDLYSELADETGDPILDVGCGSGRVMLHLAQEGLSRGGCGYLRSDVGTRAAQARNAAAGPEAAGDVYQGDILTADLPGKFKLIIVPYNGFMHFNTQAQQAAALRRFHDLLDDEGLLIFDLPNAGEAFGTQDDNAVALERMFTEPESGHLVMQQSFSTLSRITQQMHITWIYDEIMDDSTVRRTLAPLVLRYVFPGEMDLLLAAAGFRQVEVYGDYAQESFEEGCTRMIVLAERASAGA